MMFRIRCRWYYFVVFTFLLLGGILLDHFYPQMMEKPAKFLVRQKNTLLSFISKEPELDYILIEKNGEECRLRSGETMRLSSEDSFTIKDTVTNLFFGRGIETDIEGIGTDDDTNYKVEIGGLVDMVMADVLEGREPLYRITVKKDGHVFATSFLDIRLTKDDWTIRAELGRKLPDKIRCLKKAVGLDPSDTEVRVYLADLYMRKGRKGDLTKAIAELEEVVKRRPTDKEVYEKLIYLYKETNNSNKLIETYKGLIRLEQRNEILHYNLGVLLEDKAKHKSAISEFSKAARINPKDASTHVHLAYNYTKIGDLRKAISEYERAEKLNDRDHAISFNLAVLYEKVGKIKEAIKEYEKARRLKPGDTEILAPLAELYMDNKNYKKAIPLYEKVVKSISKDPVIWGRLGYAYSEEKMWRKALTSYNKSLKNGSDDAITHLNLAILFERLNDIKSAVDEYKKALEKDPSLNEAKEKIPKLSIELLRYKQKSN